MEVKEFIKNSLIDICEGVMGAQEYFQEMKNDGKRHLVSGISINTHNRRTYESGKDYSLVEFDIAVTASESTATKGKGGIKVLSVELGAEAGNDKHNQSISRLKFEIPISFSVQS